MKETKLYTIKVNKKIIAGSLVVKNGKVKGIEYFGVLKQYRHKGYGRKLIEKILSKEKGIILLTTRHAMEFYKHNGFKEVYRDEEGRSYMLICNDLKQWLF